MKSFYLSSEKGSQGYVGLIVLMIVCAIIAYFMMKEFVTYGVLPEEKSSMYKDVNDKSPVTTQSQTPIEKALNIKGVLEKRDQNTFNQANQ